MTWPAAVANRVALVARPPGIGCRTVLVVPMVGVAVVAVASRKFITASDGVQ